jgi:hypothetical protein
MAATTSVYTDVSKCGGYDTKWDLFHHDCTGPGGREVRLLYVEGVASVIVDGDDESPAAKAKITVGGKGKVFGEKLEWRVRDGKPCAVIAWVSTDRGSRLVVTSLATPAQVFGLEQTNKDAQKTSELACDSVSKPYTPPDEIAFEIRGDWALPGQCGSGNKVSIGQKAFSVTYSGQKTDYDKVEKAYGFLHGGTYSGREYALAGYNKAGDTFETIIVVNADETEGQIKLNPETEELSRSWSGIVDKVLKRCP